MTAKDHMRQKLDELMGTGWDGVKNSLHYSDPKVCRCFLLGLCPHDALAGTKMSMGPCSKIHNYALKADFENSSRLYRPGQHRFYELTVLTYLQKVIRSCEILDRAKKGRLTRCQSTARNNRHGDKEAALKSYGELVDKKLVEAEELGNKGKVQEALAVIREVERLKRRRNRLERVLDRKSNEPVKEQKQNICEECQLCIGLDDNEQRIANHSSGRLHNAILEMRRKITELATSLEKSQMPGDWARLDAAQQQTKQCTSRLDLASTRAHSYSPRSSRSDSRSSSSRSRSRSRSSRRSYSSDCSSSRRSSTSRSRSRSGSCSTYRGRSRKSSSKSHRKSRSRSSRRRSSRSGSESRYSSSCSRSSCSRSRSRSRSCSSCSRYSDRSRSCGRHHSHSRSRSNSRSRHRRGHRRRRGDSEPRSRTPRKADGSKESPDKAEEKTASVPTQSPEKETRESATKDDSKRSRAEETESPERPTQKNRPSHLETKERESKKHAMTANITKRTNISGPLSSKQDSPKGDPSSTLDDRASATTGGGPSPKDSNSDVADKAKSPISDTVFNKLKRRLAKSKYTHEDVKAKEIKASASSEENAAPVTEAADHVTQSKVPSEKKKPKEKTKVVTVVKDWNTIKKPMINIANIRHFKLAQGNKKNTQKQQIEDDLTAGQAPTKKPDIGLPADVDSASTKGQIEAPENDTTDKSLPDQNEVQNENVGTDSQRPLKSASDKEDGASELSEGEIRSESSRRQGDSADNSPRSNNLEEEPEVFSTKKRRKGVKTKKKRRSPVRESTQTEDSGDESACSESSTYYQLVKKPKKSAKNRKKSLKKKTKVDSSRMSRKAVVRKSRRHSRSSTEEEDDGDSESSTSYDSPPPAKRTKTKKSKKRLHRSPAAKRDGSKKSSTSSTKVRKSWKKKNTSTGKKRSKVSVSTKASSSKAKSKRKLSSDSSSSSSASDSPERRPKRKLKTVKKTKTKRKKCK